MDKALKQRLVGASVLIALAVIVLPMLFSGQPNGSGAQSQSIELPPHPAELNFETRRFPVGETPPAGPVVEATQANEVPRFQNGESTAAVEPVTGAGDAVTEDPAPAVPDRGPSNSDPEPTTSDLEPSSSNPEPSSSDTAAQQAPGPGDEPVVPSLSDDAPPAQPAAIPAPLNSVESSPAGAAPGRYVVQVASLGNSENAQRLVEELTDSGFGVLKDTVESDTGRLNRVRVGPFVTENEANAAAGQVRNSIEGVNPRVVDLQPERAASVTTPADPLVRWVVQVGSYAEEANAEGMVSRLRSEGLSAYREIVQSATSSLYRVRVGPFLEREEAIRTQELLQQRHSIIGVVMSAD